MKLLCFTACCLCVHVLVCVCLIALQPVTKLQAGASPVIFKQQQVVVQQMTPQSYVKSSGQSVAGGTHIQHIITSLPVTASSSSTASTAGLLTTHIVGQAGSTATTVAVTPPQVTFTKTLSLTITTTAIPTSKSLLVSSTLLVLLY